MLEKIANAVLYEGFLLYPYRKSSLKNQHRWHLGTIEPGGLMQTECLVEGGGEAVIEIRIRFLQDETEREVRIAEGCGLQEFVFGALRARVEAQSTVLSNELFRLTVRIVNGSGKLCDAFHAYVAGSARRRVRL